MTGVQTCALDLFTANIFVAGTDALLAGITRSAVEGVPGIPANVPVHPLINWYFMIAATFILTFLTVYVTERYTVRMLGDDEGGRDEEALRAHAVTPAENRGLFCALLALVAYVALIVWLTYLQGSLFVGSIFDIDGVGFGAATTRINRTALSDTFGAEIGRASCRERV